jgi:hypothetical protein
MIGLRAGEVIRSRFFRFLFFFCDLGEPSENGGEIWFSGSWRDAPHPWRLIRHIFEKTPPYTAGSGTAPNVPEFLFYSFVNEQGSNGSNGPVGPLCRLARMIDFSTPVLF